MPNSRWISRNDHWKSKNNPSFTSQKLRERELYGKHWDKDIMSEYDQKVMGSEMFGKHKIVDGMKVNALTENDISSLSTAMSASSQILQKRDEKAVASQVILSI